MTAIAEPRTRRRSIALTIPCSLLSPLFFVAAAMKLFACPFEVTNFAHSATRPGSCPRSAWSHSRAVFLAIDRTRGPAALATSAAITLALCLVVSYARRSHPGSIARR